MTSLRIGAASVLTALLVGCGGSASDDSAPTTAATTVAGISTTSSVPMSTSPPVTTTSTAVASTTSTMVQPTTTAPASTSTTTTTVPEPRTLVSLDRPAGRVAVFSDSMFADQTGDFQLFDLVKQGLLQLGVEASDVRNYSVPGQGILDGLEIAEPGWHLLGSYLTAVGDDPYLEDLGLAIIGIGRVDVNRLGQDTTIDVLAEAIAAELAAIAGGFEARGTQVVIVPSFGANDEMFDALQCVAAGRCEPQETDAKFAALNDALVAADLPVLFDRYDGIDLDAVAGTDQMWFVDFDPVGRWPDDGQHPNLAGERLIAEQVLFHLAVAFGVEPLND